MTDDDWLDGYRLGLGTGIVALESIARAIAALPVQWVHREVIEQWLADMASGLREASAGARL